MAACTGRLAPGASKLSPAELNVHPNLIRRAIRSGELQAVHPGEHGHYRIRGQGLDEFPQPMNTYRGDEG